MSRSTRNWLLVFLALTTGMIAQELLGKLSSARDSVYAADGQGPVVWSTAENFYDRHPLAFAETPVAAVEQDPLRPLTEGAATEPPASAIAIAPEPSSIAENSASPATEQSVTSSTNDNPQAIAVQPDPPPALANATETPEPNPARAGAPTPMGPADELPTPDVASAAEPKANDGSGQPPTIQPVSPSRRAGYEPNSARRERDRLAAAAAEVADRAIHQRAALKAAERSRRLETFKWYGYSPSRPTVTPGVMGGNAGGNAVTLGPPVLFYTR